MKEHDTIDSLKNNNCLLNAFSLAFIDFTFEGNLEKLAKEGKFQIIFDTINQLYFPLEIKVWEAFVQYLTQHKNEPEYLQEILAPVFREIAANCKEEPTEGELADFSAEFREFLAKEFELPMDVKHSGDIFLKSKDLVNKFREVKNDIETDLRAVDFFNMETLRKARNKNLTNDEESMQSDIFTGITEKHTNKLNDWFKKSGYKTFNNHMSKWGEWAGDIELEKLGVLLGFDVYTLLANNSPYIIHKEPDANRIPSHLLNDEQKKLLIERGILEKNENEELCIVEISKNELIKRLKSVNNADTIYNAYLTENSILPFLQEEELAQLRCRGVILDDHIVPNLDETSLYSKLGPIDDIEKILQLWETYYRPSLVFSNPDIIHWYYKKRTDFHCWDLSMLSLEAKENLKTLKKILKQADEPLSNLLSDITTPADDYDEFITGLLNTDEEAQLPDINLEAREIKPKTNPEIISTSPKFLSKFFPSQSPPTPPEPPFTKRRKIDSAMINDALSVLEIFKKLENQSSELINDLKKAFRVINTCGEITPADASLILFPQEYMKIENSTTTDFSLPEKIETFKDKYYCKILFQALRFVEESINEVFFSLLDIINDVKNNDPSANTLKLIQALQNNFNSQTCHQLKSFDINEVDTLRDSCNSMNINSTAIIEKIKHILNLTKLLIIQKSDIKKSAKSILNQLNNEQQNNKKWELFNEFATKELSTIETTYLNEILKLPITNDDQSLTDYFLMLHKDDIQSQKNEREQTFKCRSQ